MKLRAMQVYIFEIKEENRVVSETTNTNDGDDLKLVFKKESLFHLVWKHLNYTVLDFVYI